MFPRGMRVNNPGNIEATRPGLKPWKGEIRPSRDKRFATFIDLKSGCRAMLKLLYNYVTRKKQETVREIISAWAPSSENKTEAYIAHVCQLTGYMDDQPIEPTFECLEPLADAIARHEQGKDYVSSVMWREAWEDFKGKENKHV